MKRFLALLLAAILALSCLAACNVADEDDSRDDEEVIDRDDEDEDEDEKETEAETEPETEAPDYVGDFMFYITNGEYLKAIECYNTHLYGNYSLETASSEQVAAMLADLNAGVLAGEKTEADVKQTVTVVDKVLAETDLYIENYDELIAYGEQAVASKAAFLEAKDLEALKNYADAMLAYQSVMEGDSNYTEAQAGAQRCIATLKTETFEAVTALAQENKYIEAIAQLKALAEILPEDAEVLSKLSVFEKTYISYTLKSAEAAFVTPATDYTKALDIVNAALQQYPDNEELIAKKAYYTTFAPVSVYDMTPIKGKALAPAKDTDTYGNQYGKCFCTEYNGNTDVTFDLNKEYNIFSAVVYGRSKDNKGYDCTVQIYIDGYLEYENLRVSDNNTRPFSVELDVTGATELRIVIIGVGMSCEGVGLTNMTVQRTVK